MPGGWIIACLCRHQRLLQRWQPGSYNSSGSHEYALLLPNIPAVMRAIKMNGLYTSIGAGNGRC